jgi:hypothetical protein
MSDAKHTPGPWRVCGWENLVVNAANGETIVACLGGSLNTTLPELQANAALIASAPALAAECDQLRAALSPMVAATNELAVALTPEQVSNATNKLVSLCHAARAALDQPAP